MQIRWISGPVVFHDRLDSTKELGEMRGCGLDARARNFGEVGEG